jgi:hypothetical protein
MYVHIESSYCIWCEARVHAFFFFFLFWMVNVDISLSLFRDYLESMGCVIYIGVNAVFMYHTYIICTHTDTGLCLKFGSVICWRVPLCGKLRDTDLRQATAHNINLSTSCSVQQLLRCTTRGNYDRSPQLGSSQQDLKLLPTQTDVTSNFQVMTS